MAIACSGWQGYLPAEPELSVPLGAGCRKAHPEPLTEHRGLREARLECAELAMRVAWARVGSLPFAGLHESAGGRWAVSSMIAQCDEHR